MLPTMQITAAIPRPRVSALQVAEVKAATRRASVPFLASRLGLMLVTFVAAHMSDVAPSGGPAQPAPTLHDLLWRWYFWDGANYTAIASAGYPVTHPERLAFFPLLPLLQHVAALGTSHVFYAGLVVANACCFGACVLLELLAPVRPGRIPVSALLLASPFAFFLAAPFTESLLLLLACGCLLALRRGQFSWAIACCALATATHATGVALLAPIAYTYLRKRGVTWRSLVSTVPVLLASLGGLLSFALYCLLTTGDALAFATVERMDYGRAPLWPWQTVGAVVSGLMRSPVRPLLDVIPLVLAIAVFAVAANRLPVEQLLYSAGVLALIITFPMQGTDDPLISSGRYLLTIAPLYLVLHRWSASRPWLGWLLIGGGALAQALLAGFELRHGWLP